MDVLVKCLCDSGFTRLNTRLVNPVIIHCVPGAGKTTCIKKLLGLDSRFVALTAGIAEKPNLTGRWLQKFKGQLIPDKFNLIDEYTLIEDCPVGAFACFGDPLQSNKSEPKPADFVCYFSHRFGSATAGLLKELGFEVEAEGQDSVQIADIYSVDPREQVLYFEDEVGALLCRHSLEAKHVSEVIGQTFQSVTFVTSLNNPSDHPVEVFQCITRHRSHLLILCPNATFTASR
jgi:hypothetical protein